MNWVQKLNWSGLVHYNNATRQRFIAENGEVDLYLKEHGNFQFYWLLGAGHAVCLTKWFFAISSPLLPKNEVPNKIKCFRNIFHLTYMHSFWKSVRWQTETKDIPIIQSEINSMSTHLFTCRAAENLWKSSLQVRKTGSLSQRVKIKH